MVEQIRFKSGDRVPVTGFYVIVDATGAQPADLPGSDYGCNEGDPFPATPRAGLWFRLRLAAHHAGDAPAAGEASDE